MIRRLYSVACNLVKRKKKRCIARLLSRHPELKISDESLIVFTAIWHRPNLLPWLLKHGVSADCRLAAGDNTPLMQAAADGDVSMTKILLEFGADPNAVNARGETPLGFSVVWNHPEIVQLLIDAGADVNSTSDFGTGQTLLNSAEISGYTEVARILRRGS